MAAPEFCWRIHAGLLEGRTEELASVVADWGDALQLVFGHWRALPPPDRDAATAGLALTTLQDATRLPGQGWMAPRMLYFHSRRYDVSFWMPRIAEAIPVLNRGCAFVPFGLIAHMPAETQERLLAQGSVFIRPDSGLKAFPGVVLDLSGSAVLTWPDVVARIQQELRTCAPELLACVGPGRQLDPLEWRFWVVDRQVVASTPYSWELDAPWGAPPQAAYAVADAMAKNPWQPDIAYVVDVVRCIQTQAYYLNELNAASTSGLYSAPLRPLLSALRHAVLAEAAGELSVEAA